MQTVKAGIVVLVLTFFSFAAPSYGADVAKVGIIDFQKILDVSSAGKAAADEIKKQGKTMEADLKEKGAQIEDIKKKLERDMVMSKEMREEKEREIRIKIDDFKILEKKYNEELRELNKRLIKRLQEEILELIEEMGKKEGYLLILEKREGGLLYFPNTIDLTDKLVQQYNVRFAQKSNKPAKTK